MWQLAILVRTVSSAIIAHRCQLTILFISQHKDRITSDHHSRAPEFKLSGNIAKNWRNFEMRFNDYAISRGYRDCDKNPDVDEERAAHYKKSQMEISSMRLCLPDETLSLLRYTITPQIADTDKNKPWIWMEKLRIHYTGASSTKLTDRYNFSALTQSPSDTIQSWEIKVR